MNNQQEHPIVSTPLGQATDYVDTYSPELLHPIPRAEARETLSLSNDDFVGKDLWTCYEVSWLNNHGLPQIGVLTIDVPADSPNIVESKSLKLYLNGYNQEQTTSDDLAQRVQADLRKLLGHEEVRVHFLDKNQLIPQAFTGKVLDQLSVSTSHYDIEPSLLVHDRRNFTAETVVTHLFRSNCPVTNQPDWASVMVRYQGKGIDHKGLLAYLVSYRKHQGFHEQCVENIYRDIWQQCQPEQLLIYARFLRRGGIDINPLRASTAEYAAGFLRADAWRQPRQ